MANFLVIVFGPYEPDECRDRLVRLRDGLRQTGWTKTFLVSDLESDEDAYRKSIRALRESDVNLLVFLMGCSEGGVTVEGTEVLNNPALRDKSIFLIEAHLTRHFISEVVDTRPEFRRIYHREIAVGNDLDLLEHAKGSLISTVARRPPLLYFR